jgi:redox-sensitive bicupin YhaK (pirin superfamily)
MLWRSSIPQVRQRDEGGKETLVTVIAGRLGAASPPPPPPRSWASRPGSDVAIWTIKIETGGRWTLPRAAAGSNRMLYFFAGSELRVGGRAIPVKRAVSLRAELDVLLEAGRDEVELLLLQGKPIGEPVVQRGPFVMNAPGEIQQAFIDYQRTRFGGWPWRSDGPVHEREERFARHADGRIERAT